MRTIEIPQKDNTKHRLRDVSSDTSLAEIMIRAVANGKLAAYTAKNKDLSTKLGIADIYGITNPGRVDTQIVIDLFRATSW